MKNSDIPIYTSEAFLWNGIHRIPGILELHSKEICFRMNSFNQSHAKLLIPLVEVQKIEEFLVFDLAKKGLRILGSNGKFDLFVLQEGKAFKKEAQKQIGKMQQGDR